MKDPNEIPDEATLNEAASLEIFTANGDKITFGSLFAEQKTVVVFIRGYFTFELLDFPLLFATCYPSTPTPAVFSLFGADYGSLGHFFCGVSSKPYPSLSYD